jgi:hypothetical protein
MNLTEYATHRGLTYQAVQKAIAAKRITPLPDGSIDPIAADKQWEANTDFTKSRPKNGVGSAQEMKVRAETALLHTKLKKELGQFIPKGEVISFVRATMENLKNHFLTRGTNLAPKLAGETDIGKIGRIMEDDARKMIREFRDDLEQRIKSLDGQQVEDSDTETGLSERA